MTKPRSDTVIDEESCYHCVARCVRRAFLYGTDSYSGKNFDHRKGWIRDRLMFLVKVFCIEVLTCALMDNHLHLGIRTRPDILRRLSERDIARLWLTLYPKHPGKPTKGEITALSSDSSRIETLRARLGSISWFMKSLTEFMARKANKEDDCKGRFWEGRFRCQRLRGEAALLGCAIYIDLNPVRAMKAKTPEESEHTSAYERIENLKKGNDEKHLWLTPIHSIRGRRGFLSISLEQYLKILDETGRVIKKGKRGSISKELEPILVRLGIKPKGWAGLVSNLGNSFSSLVSDKDTIQQCAAAKGMKWLKGLSVARGVFA